METLENIPLKNHTTIGTGGPARYFLKCSTIDDIKNGLSFAKAKNLRVLVLGGGSNLLIADAGFSGLVLHIATQNYSITEDGQVIANAGVNWHGLVSECCRRGLAGIETLAGIPGLVGATPIQNVGAYGQEVAHVITKVETLDRLSLKTSSFTARECQFAYRQSRFKTGDIDRFIITSVTFQLSPSAIPTPKYDELRATLEGDSRWKKATRGEKIILMREHVLKIRSLKGMVLDSKDPDTRSVGSFFVNPVVSTSIKENVGAIAAHEQTVRPFVAHPVSGDHWKLSAAWLIENSGIAKGLSYGGARVSSKHVLAITNQGTASTQDILDLADIISRAVEKKFGICLEREPVLVS